MPSLQLVELAANALSDGRTSPRLALLLTTIATCSCGRPPVGPQPNLLGMASAALAETAYAPRLQMLLLKLAACACGNGRTTVGGGTGDLRPLAIAAVSESSRHISPLLGQLLIELASVTCACSGNDD